MSVVAPSLPGQGPFAGIPLGPNSNNGGFETNGTYIAPNTPGTWYLVTCSDGTTPGLVFNPQRLQVNPVDLAQLAKSHLSLPPPQLQLSPAANHLQYVQMPTWAWIPPSAWTPLTASASAGPVTVGAIATPTRIVLTYQTADATQTTTCTGPGTPYSNSLAAQEDPALPVQAASPDCGWIWHQSSAASADQQFGVTAHVVYHVTWRAAGATGGGDLGEINGAETTFRVGVAEIQALNR